MTAGVELAVGYVSLVTDASQVSTAIDKAFGAAGRSADQAGASIGSKLASGIGRTLTAGAAVAGTAAGTFIGTALVKGMGRLTAIDDAQGKLAGLGHDAKSVAEIMDSAMASVKGTAFGLGDAATVAASSVAAGVKPGEELTRTLKLIADTATIAGTEMSDMGSIFNGVATSGVIQGDSIAQLSDRGIPIIQMLAKELGVTSAEVTKLASDSKIDFATFQNAMENGLGGAALESGKTVSGALKNVNAAMGRLGASALEPTFNRLTGWLSSSIEGIDGMTAAVKPFAKSLDSKIFDDIIPSAQAFWESFRDSDAAQSTVQRVSALIGRVGDVASDVAPAVLSIGRSLGEASAAAGVSSWQVFLSVLEATAQIAETVLVPVLQLTAGLMSSNQVAVTALVLAFVAFKTIPALLSRIATPLQAVGTRAQGAAGGIRGFSDSMRVQQALAASSGQSLSRYGAAFATLQSRSGVLTNMTTSFQTASTNAARFNRTMGTISAASTGVRSAMSGLAGVVGGPLNAGLLVGAGLFLAWSSSTAKAKAQAEAYDKAVQRLVESQGDMQVDLFKNGGAIDDNVFGKLTGQVDAIKDKFKEGDADAKWNNVASDIIGDTFNFGVFENDDISKNMDEIALKNREATKAIEATGLSSEQVSRILSGGNAEWAELETRLRAAGEGGNYAADELGGLRVNLLASQDAAKRVTPGIVEVSEQLDILADSAASAEDKSSALKRTLDILAGVPPDLQESVAAYNETVQDIMDSTQGGWDPSKGFGDELVNQTTGAVDTATENGRKLFETLKKIRSDTEEQAGAEAELGPIFAQNDELFQRLADSAGVSTEAVEAMAAALGYIPEAIVATVELEGSDGVTRELSNVKLFMDQATAKGEPQVVRFDALTGDAQTRLRELGFQVDEIKTGDKTTFEVIAKTDGATFGLDAILGKLRDVGGVTAVPQVDLNKTSFDLNADQVQGLLSLIGNQRPSPEADLVISKLLENKDVSIQELLNLAQQSADPQVFLEGVQQVVQDAGVVNAAIDNASRDRVVHVQVVDPSGFINGDAGTISTNPNRFGTIQPQRVNADGGIDNLPSQATIQPGRGGGLVQWAEGETGGEAYIPMSLSKRGRSTGILAEVASRFGFSLQKYADGGIRAALAAGRGVDGNDYLWGATGPTRFDCSGFVGWLQQIAMGIVGSTSRLYTTLSLIGGATAGLVSGLGPAGTLFQVGVSDEHMAATVDGHAAESGGAHGTSGIDGGRAKAQDGQFPHKFHLPNSMISDLASAVRGSERVQWSDTDEVDLKSAEVSVTQAEEARDKVYGDATASDADKQQADLKVEKAQQKVLELQGKKDDAASGVPDGPAPEAPELSRRYSDDEASRIDAEAAVESAKLRRNEVYADPAATETDRLKADVELSKALDGLTTAGTAPSSGSEGGVKGVLRDLVTDTAGILFDAALEQLPFDLGQSRWWHTDFSSLVQPKDAIGPLPSFSPQDVLSQFGFNPNNGIPAWVEQLRKGATANVFDQGGKWESGDLGINLSGKTEAVFNSEQMLNLNRIANLDVLKLPPSPQPGPSVPSGPRVKVDNHNHITVSNEKSQMRQLKLQNQLALMQYGGGV